MNTAWIFKGLKMTKGVVVQYAPEILTGLGCAGVVLTGFSAVRDTRKHALAEAERAENRRKAEIVLDAAHDYAPTIVAAALTMATIILSNRMSAKRIAGLAAALAASQKQFAEFKAAARDVVDPNTVDKIEEKARKAQYASDGPIWRWKESISGDEFYAPESDVLRAEMEVNRRFHKCHGVGLNEFRHEINIGPMDRSVDYAWDKDDMPDVKWINFIHAHEVDMKGEYINITYGPEPVEVMI